MFMDQAWTGMKKNGEGNETRMNGLKYAVAAMAAVSMKSRTGCAGSGTGNSAKDLKRDICGCRPCREQCRKPCRRYSWGQSETARKNSAEMAPERRNNGTRDTWWLC